MLQHIMLINCVLVLKYSQSTVFISCYEEAWQMLPNIKKWKMLKVKLQFFVEKKRRRHMFLLQGYVTELLPGGKVSGHEAAQLENMSKISYLLIFLFCRMEKLHQRKWRRGYSEIWLWWRHDILLGRELNENSPSRWNEGWSCVFLSALFESAQCTL